MPPLHTRISDSLKDDGTWAAISAAFGTLATQVPEPYNYVAYTACAIAVVVSAVLKGNPNG